jgi:hypothetical protein
MLDCKTQSQFVDATAQHMALYLRAATTTFAASASHSMSLWTEMLEAKPRQLRQGNLSRPAVRRAHPGRRWCRHGGRPSVTFWALADWRV